MAPIRSKGMEFFRVSPFFFFPYSRPPYPPTPSSSSLLLLLLSGKVAEVYSIEE